MPGEKKIDSIFNAIDVLLGSDDAGNDDHHFRRDAQDRDI